MSEKSKRYGQATLGAGLVSGTAAVNANRIANHHNALHEAKYDAKINALKNGKYGLDVHGNPVDKIPTEGMYKHRQKIEAQYENRLAGKRKGTALRDLGQKRKNVPWSLRTRGKFIGATTALAIPATVLGAHYSVDKSLKRHDVDSGVAGAAVGGAAYQGASYALKPLDRHFERQLREETAGRASGRRKSGSPRVDLRSIDEWKKLRDAGKGPAENKLSRYSDRLFGQKVRGAEGRKILQEHKKASGFPKGTPVAGAAEWRNYFKTYPTNLPGGRMKRVLAHTHTGPSGMALTGLAAAATGAAAYQNSRHHYSGNSVSKSSNIRSHSDLDENIYAWMDNALPIRRNPISPLQMLSAGVLQAKAQAYGRGEMLMSSTLNRRGLGVSNANAYGLIMNAPAGRGTMMT